MEWPTDDGMSEWPRRMGCVGVAAALYTASGHGQKNNIAGFLDITQQVLSVRRMYSIVSLSLLLLLMSFWGLVGLWTEKDQNRSTATNNLHCLSYFWFHRTKHVWSFCLAKFLPTSAISLTLTSLTHDNISESNKSSIRSFGLQSIARLCTWIWHSMLDVFPVSIESDMLFTCKCMQFQQHEVVFTPLQFQLSCANCTFYHPTVAAVTKVTSKWQAFNLSINLPSISVNAMVVAPSFFIWSSGQDTSPCIWHAIFMKNLWHERLETVCVCHPCASGHAMLQSG